MRSEWNKVSINSLCNLVSSGGTPSRKIDEYYIGGNIKWLKTKELFDTNIYDTEEYITELGLKKSSAKLYPSNTIVLAMYGATVGKLGIMKSEMSTNQACCCMVVNEEKADYMYLFYGLLLNRGRLINLANGAAQQNLNSQIIKDYEIDIPPLPIQKKISQTEIIHIFQCVFNLIQDLNSLLPTSGRQNLQYYICDNVVHKKFSVVLKVIIP